MANKRVKGVKVDLAALYDGGPNALPSGPSGDPNREYNRGGRGGGRGGGYGDRDRDRDGGYGASRSRGGGGFGEDSDWGRNQDRGGSYRSGGFNDSGFDRPSGTNQLIYLLLFALLTLSLGGGLRRNDNYSAAPTPAERPAHLRLNLQPRAGSATADNNDKQGTDNVESATQNNNNNTTKEDKWDTIFKSR